MTRRSTLAAGVSIVMLLAAVTTGGYDDLTHQALSKRALQVAAEHAQGVPPDLVGVFVASNGTIKDMGRQVIDGAGKSRHGLFDKTAGEDYTKYRITHHHCNPWKVHRHTWWFEPLNHFHIG